MKRVVVTGIGLVTPLGCVTDINCKNLISGVSGAKKLVNLMPVIISVRLLVRFLLTAKQQVHLLLRIG